MVNSTCSSSYYVYVLANYVIMIVMHNGMEYTAYLRNLRYRPSLIVSSPAQEILNKQLIIDSSID